MSRAWNRIAEVLKKHFGNPDVEAARVLCSALASHALKELPSAWCMAIAPPGSMKTAILESFRGLPGVHFVDEVTPNTFISGKVDQPGKKRQKAASLLHRIGPDGVVISADFSTVTSNPKTLKAVLAQLRRIYDGNFRREFGTDENLDEREWRGRLTFFAGATPSVDKHFSVFQDLGERFTRVRWERAGGVRTGLRAIRQTNTVPDEVRAAVHALMLPILSNPQSAPVIPSEIEHKIASLGEFVSLARTGVPRDRFNREVDVEPITEGNTRLPQQLCQIARGSALLGGRTEVSEYDYSIAYRAALDSLLPLRRAVLEAILDSQSPFSQSSALPKATVSRTVEDLQIAGVLVADTTRLTKKAEGLLSSARPAASGKQEVPAISHIPRDGIEGGESAIYPVAGTSASVDLVELAEEPDSLINGE
jgi:hypothetical protein